MRPWARYGVTSARNLRANGLAAEQESVSTKLVKLALDSGIKLWHDPEGNPWATLHIDGHAEHHSLKTKAVKHYMTHLHYQETQNAPHNQGVQDALATLEAKARFEGTEYPTFTRLAEVDGVIYLDLANDRWQVVKVTPHGWFVVEADTVPVRFRRSQSLLPLPTPVQGGQITELADLLNIETDSRDWKLIVAWLLQALRGVGPYPVLVLAGGQGSGKSTAARMLRALLDPNVSPLRSLSRSEHDLFITATNGWALTFDNISGLPQWASDALCKLSTGGGLSVRELYSNAEETLLEAMRPVVLNGITDFVDKQDLVDRALQVRLPSIPKTERKPERELWERFNEARPRILGALLDTVSVGLQHLPNTTLDSPPRLIDFALWATACEAPLGWQPGTFMAAHERAQDDLVRDALEAEPVAVHLLSFATEHENWTGTASALLKELTKHAYDDKRPVRGWPGAPQVLAGTLKRIAPALLVQGLEVTQPNRDGKSRTKQWQIRTIAEDERSERSQTPMRSVKHVQNGTHAPDADVNASPIASASSASDHSQALSKKVREEQHPNAANAMNASTPISSKNAENVPMPEWSVDL